MKKVLALVLAVIMVCTMAMAIEVAVTPAEVVAGAATGLGTVTLTDTTKTYALVLKDELFTPVLNGLGAAQVGKDTMKVEGVSGSFSGANYYIPITNTDKALDGKADYSISTLKITNLKSNDTYVVYNAKDGKLVMAELVVAGVPKKVTEVDFYASYDIGYPTNTVEGTAAEGWNYLTKELKNVALNTSAVITNGTNAIKLNVAKETPFKLTKTFGDVTGLTSKYPGIAVQYVEAGYKTTAGTITYKMTGLTKDNYFYVMDKDGNLFKAPFTFAAEKQNDGTYVGTWNYTGTGFDGTLVVASTNLNVDALPGTAAGTTPGPTTNPGTGANDVVGVAAALAVVALVSGAAISLKK